MATCMCSIYTVVYNRSMINLKYIWYNFYMTCIYMWNISPAAKSRFLTLPCFEVYTSVFGVFRLSKPSTSTNIKLTPCQLWAIWDIHDKTKWPPKCYLQYCNNCVLCIIGSMTIVCFEQMLIMSWLYIIHIYFHNLQLWSVFIWHNLYRVTKKN